tara:strand:+ start:1610 stop:2104 length:495 start_codon:yes stop_codon:yes gene_type:complete
MIADGVIDILTFEDERDNLLDMSVPQLIQHKRMIIEIEQKVKNDKYYQSIDQQNKFRELQKQLDNDYDMEEAKNDVIKETLRKKQAQERWFFTKIVMNNNRFYIKNKQKLIEMIDMIIDDKKTYNHKEYMNEKIICECGCETYRKHLSRHKQTAIHLRNLEKKN